MILDSFNKNSYFKDSYKILSNNLSRIGSSILWKQLEEKYFAKVNFKN
jgi:hypothetical protein